MNWTFTFALWRCFASWTTVDIMCASYSGEMFLSIINHLGLKCVTDSFFQCEQPDISWFRSECLALLLLEIYRKERWCFQTYEREKNWTVVHSGNSALLLVDSCLHDKKVTWLFHNIVLIKKNVICHYVSHSEHCFGHLFALAFSAWFRIFSASKKVLTFSELRLFPFVCIEVH